MWVFFAWGFGVGLNGWMDGWMDGDVELMGLCVIYGWMNDLEEIYREIWDRLDEFR